MNFEVRFVFFVLVALVVLPPSSSGIICTASAFTVLPPAALVSRNSVAAASSSRRQLQVYHVSRSKVASERAGSDVQHEPPAADDENIDDGGGDDERDFEMLFEEPPKPVGKMEKAWRYAKKPLLSIGAKGANLSHGNSLRQLLESHTVVKVKVNTKHFGGSLAKAFEHLRSLAEESGAPRGVEMLQAREKDKIILFGMPGTLELIERGDFPPQP